LDDTCGATGSVARLLIPNRKWNQPALELAAADSGEAKKELITELVRNAADFEALI
jgi:hypothetical protein